MRSRVFLLATALCLPTLAAAQDDYHLPGYVTAVLPAGAFDIEGVHIRITPTTQWRIHTGSSTTSTSAPTAFYLGETLDATGYLDHATHTLTATRIDLVPTSTATVSGTAIIDLIPPATQATSDKVVRADGFLLRITEKTRLTFTAPLTSIADIATNQWIDYSGVQQLDGTVLLDNASIGRNTVGKSEDKLRTKTDYNPDTVTEADHQGGVSKFFKGTDVRRIPPVGNEDMLARVQRIGQSLIPAYQRALPDTDPTKIHFRFQVIDTTKWRDAVTMPSGVIVVPRQVIERMQNDDQLATVIADNIAENLEKDAYRLVPAGHRILAADIAGDVAGVFIPGAGIATGLTTGGIAKHLVTVQLRQSGRVSLDLLHDAGYDIDQAPLAMVAPRPQIAQAHRADPPCHPAPPHSTSPWGPPGTPPNSPLNPQNRKTKRTGPLKEGQWSPAPSPAASTAHPATQRWHSDSGGHPRPLNRHPTQHYGCPSTPRIRAVRRRRRSHRPAAASLPPHARSQTAATV